ncbi:hypothetical protein [Flavivirga spongiicola]|uniref:Uncharacterized protein n=1 Tax=Flavivirga spongiicola TaxID=421621 RepID=A0ABU7XMT3_9FLAO|nr:hypothetical protein [Flavivirga sp. MEBiC05379]MDO5981733.1 hypothetical protein [Flavivirga sp. MEBiC05379]
MTNTRKKLDGLPDALTKRYFSDTFYYKKGNMATWIWNTSVEKDIDELSINILNKEVNLKELEIKPILAFLPRLNTAISKTLENENYPSDFIKEAKFFIKIFHKNPHIKCTAYLSDKEGKKYMGDSISFNVYDNNFEHFNLRPNNDMDWASEGENQLNTSEWFGAMLRFFGSFGKRKFNSFYNQRELKKNAIIGNLFQITLMILFFYFLYRYMQSN